MSEGQSETHTCRDRLIPFCVGAGIDIGSGGDPIMSTSICVDKSAVGIWSGSPPHILCDAQNLDMFVTDSLDYVFSSHCLEDFQDTKVVLAEWLRVIKPGGHLVLFLPDEQVYSNHCAVTGQEHNPSHVHATFGLEYLLACLRDLGVTTKQIVHSLFPVPNNPYSFDLVIRK